MDTFWQDIKFGFRVLAKNPAFTLVAVLTLGLGIGANTGIFSVVRAVLLRPLPYRQPESVVQLWETKVVPLWDRRFIAVGNFMAWREQNHVFEQMALMEPDQINLTGPGNPDNVSALKTSSNVFSLLGVSPVLGRGFSTEDETEHRPVVVLSNSLWRQLGASPNIIGQIIHLDDVPHTVIAVLPADFYLPEPGDPAQLWVPLKLEPQELTNHRDHGYLAVARLKPGISLGQAQAEMDGIARRLETESIQWNMGSGVRVLSMREQLSGRIRPALLILMGAVGFVLLIACANVANLLLASANGRKREMVMRAALGAPRRRLVRQLLTESIMLAAIGGCAGIALSKLLVEALPRLLPPDLLLEIRGVEMDGSVLAFTVVLSLFTAVIFGFAPSWLATRTEINESLKFSDAHVSLGRKRFLYWMQVGQVAVTLILLAGAGLLIKSLWRLQQVNPGFDAGGVLTADLFLPETRYSQGALVARFHDELLKKIGGLPGVRSVALTNVLPLAGRGGISFSIEWHPEPPRGTYIANEQRFVTADYFKTLQIPLLRGRTFSDQDTSQSPLVTIINETIARQFFALEDPIGKRIKWSRLDDQNFPWWFTVIGMVGDTREIALESPPLPELYMFTPQVQGSAIPWGHQIGLQAFLITRTENDPLLLSTVIPKLLWGLDRDAPITHFQAYKQVVETSVAQPRMITLLLTLFSGLALVISITGLYGVISYAVSQRTREIGIRIAIGAQPKALSILFLWSGLRMALPGVALGLLGVWAGSKLMSSFLYAVSPTDKVILGLVCVVLILVSALASFIPARRATKVDPIAVLRCE